MTSLTFRERMSGYLTLGQRDYNEGLRIGRAEGTRCSFTLEIDVAEIGSFIAAADHPAAIRGTFECGAFGGVLAVQDGLFNLFAPQRDANGGLDDRHMRMRYLLHVIDREGRPLTVAGFKDVTDSQGLDIWSDTTTLLVRVISGHVDEDTGKDVLAAGVMTISHLGLARMMMSMRGRGGSLFSRLMAVARFQKTFVGTLAHVYGGRQRGADQPDFPDPQHPAGDPYRGHQPGEWHELEGHPGLQRRILPLQPADGRELTIHNIRRDIAATDPPVICIHGTGVRGDIFVGVPGGSSFAGTLVDAGYDVWIPNWRASIDMPPMPYTLDDGATLDHPAAIAEVRRQTGVETVRAVVHCQGSTSFTMSTLLGNTDDVSHVVSSAVSLFTHIPPATLRKGRMVVPLIGLRMKYISAQWGVRSPTMMATGFGRLARNVRRECDNPVCALGNYMYGTGPDVLWVHEKMGESAHDWISREFGFAPYAFLKQMNRCTRAKHLVRAAPDVATDDLLERRLPEGQRWTFIAGTKNRLYLPSGQVAAHEHFSKQHGSDDFHKLVLLDGYGHLDPFLSPSAPVDVFPAVLAGLAD